MAQEQYDVVVVGSGAGALSTAVTAAKGGLKVLVLEKESLYGGTTARSGGVLWVPCNPKSRALGIEDSEEEARQYLQHETGARFDAARVDAFLQNGPRMVDFFERETQVRFVAVPEFSDYHPDAPGGKPGGRSLVAEPYDAGGLGDQAKYLRPPLREITFVGMMFNASQEIAHFFNFTRSLKSAVYVARRLIQHAGEMIVHGRAQRLTNGNALVARLARSAFDAGVEIRLDSPVTDLLLEDGVVKGVEVARNGVKEQLRTKLGVVLAAGGFPQAPQLRKKLFQHSQHYSPAPLGNTGDSWRMAQAAGARTVGDLPNNAAWIPVSLVPRGKGEPGVFPHLIDRYKPGVIAVDHTGKRFVNEAHSYHDVGQAMQASCAGRAETSAWLICDHRAIRRYGMGYVKPFPLPLLPHMRSGYLVRGRTPAELAKKIGVSPAALEGTIERFNKHAERGEDPEFGKGSTAYNRYLGDKNNAPNPCVAPLATGPYYAIKMVMGDLGTFAGIQTDERGRALDSVGNPIPGLLAVGNDALSIMGGNYPGGGITLGPAMTFGYIAGLHLAAMGMAQQSNAQAPTESRQGVPMTTPQ
jgi:succinate dehydrogenase/fumarate reductase flavoprotein subunit